MDKELVWYACYGANLSRERFLTRYISACSDKTPPRGDRPYIFHAPLYFGGPSNQWGGGVAFLANHRDSGKTVFGRAYLITREQLGQIQIEEGPRRHWYGRQLALGSLDGHPVYTLTREKEYDFTAPAPAPENYLAVIRAGLEETYPGLDAQAYLDGITAFTRGLMVGV